MSLSMLQHPGASSRLRLLQLQFLPSNSKRFCRIPGKFQAGMSTAALPPKPKSQAENEKFPEFGDEEIDGCRVKHGELANGPVKLHFVECGDPSGELVVLLHGFPNFWYVWERQFRALTEAGYHVIAPDIRGFNTSDKPGRVESYYRRKLQSDVLRFIDHFGGGRPAILVGHDWGGWISWAVAEDYPEKLSRVVIVNAPYPRLFAEALRSNPGQMLRSCLLPAPSHPRAGDTAIQVLPKCTIRTRYRFLRKVLEHGPCKPLHQDGIERHVQAYSKPGAVTAAVNLYRAALRPDLSRQEKDPALILLPVLVIWGEQDPYISKELDEPPRDMVLNATVIRLPKDSHWPMWDEPDTFNDHILQFLKRTGD